MWCQELESVIGALKSSVTKAEASFVDLDEAKKLITVKGGYGVVMFATNLSLITVQGYGVLHKAKG